MDRIEKVRSYVDGIIQKIEDEGDRKMGYTHLYGVSQNCALLAMKRNEDAELATIAGLLHDIYTYKMLDIEDHAHKGSVLAREILESLGCFEEGEISKISQAINNHSDKAIVNDSLDEILKDADVMNHCFYNPLASVAEHEKVRYNNLKKEFGLK